MKRRRTLAPLATLLLMLVVAPPGGAAEPKPEARYLDTRIVTLPPDNPQNVVVRGVIEVNGPQRWYDVYFQVLSASNVAIRRPDGSAVNIRWGNIFPPENVEWARYSDVRIDIPIADLAGAGLPKNARVLLWVQCDLFDQEAKAYVGGGWDVKAPLIVNTDEAGRPRSFESFETRPFDQAGLTGHHATARAAARKETLALRHLKPKDGASFVRTMGLRHEPYDVATLGERQALLTSDARGRFFGPIDSAEKAMELVQLAEPNAVVIKTPEQYQAIVEAMKKVPGWDPAKFLPVAQPAAYGAQVTSEPGLGWRVRMLIAWHHPYLRLGLRDVTYHDVRVATDGRMGVTETVCLRAPQTPYGAPPGWLPEFGFTREPATTAPNTGGSVPNGPGSIDPESAIDAHNKAIRSALTPAGSETIAPLIKVTEDRTDIAAPADRSGGFITDHAQWPAQPAP